MNKKLKITALVLIVCVIVIGGVMWNSSNNPNTLTLGLMLPLTGDYAAAGQNMQKGMELALEEYKKIHPDFEIKIVVEDDGYEVKKGLSAYRKLVDFDKVDAILMLSTPVIDAIHEDVVKTGIPVIQLGVQTVGVSDDNIIQFSPAAEAPIGYLATYLSKDPSFSSKKVAVVYDNSAAQIDFFKTFEKNFTHPFTTFVVDSKDDLRGYASKIAAENYEAVVVIESPQNGALLTKEILVLDSSVPSLSFDAQLQTGFNDYVRILGDANKINGAKTMWFKEGKTSEFNKLFQKKYGEAPGFLADFAFDMVNTALATYESDDVKWVNNLKQFSDVNGVSGSISFDEKGVRIQPMTITQVQNGKLVPIE